MGAGAVEAISISSAGGCDGDGDDDDGDDDDGDGVWIRARLDCVSKKAHVPTKPSHVAPLRHYPPRLIVGAAWMLCPPAS